MFLDPRDPPPLDFAVENTQHAIKKLCDELRIILGSGSIRTTLPRQAQILEGMFTLVLRNYIEQKPGWNASEKELALALDIQRQCLATVKANAAIDYMDAIMANMPRGTASKNFLPPPSPESAHAET
ncbi:MAG TPA: hypothetical protein PKX38_09405 [Alphaproteobacteria bacterium]|nr:hypothetical protein [Micavibrio sp.]MBK9563566.1 hypothetical protein [Micavibrio sp.]HQX28134.1 hypothetical protein [Alphaproteobacteria bacterium]